MKTIVNIRAALTISGILLVTGAVVGTFFGGYAVNKLISLLVCLLFVALAFAVFPLYAKIDSKGIEIFYAFGIKRGAEWTKIHSIVKSRGLFREFFFYPVKGKKREGLKADFPAYRKLEKLINEYWRGLIAK